jgi:hypothetical protein
MALSISEITIDGKKREYCVINGDNYLKNDKVLLGFPGGGQTIESFYEYTQFSNISNTVIVFLGQNSWNSHTFQNAFPWLYTKNNQNDVLFVDSVLNLLFSNKMPNLFLTGKSDGAGFAILYSNLSEYNSYIKGICVCSGAYFGLNSPDNIGIYNSENRYINSNGVIVPYNIVLPRKNIPVFIFHGKSDDVAYYNGANYVNQNAYNSKSLWDIIDPTVNPGSTPITTNTYTANIPDFVSKIITNNNLTQYYSSSNSEYSWSSYNNNETGCVLNFIAITGQYHCWSGHIEKNIPNSRLPSNLYLDSTYLFIKFADLSKGDYVQTEPTVPNNLLTYENINMDQAYTKMTATVTQTNADGVTSTETMSSTATGTTKTDANNAACNAIMSTMTNVMNQMMNSTTTSFKMDVKMG